MAAWLVAVQDAAGTGQAVKLRSFQQLWVRGVLLHSFCIARGLNGGQGGPVCVGHLDMGSGM